MREQFVPPAGNVYDKFNTRNPVARLLVNAYKLCLQELIQPLSVTSVLEVGCGEGYIVEFAIKINRISIIGTDLDPEIVSEARRRCPSADFVVADGLSLPYRNNSFDLVLACEVLEHVGFPENFLEEVRRVSKRYCLVSVPREPIWRIMNLLRGAYLSRLGDTPGHVQHWNAQALIQLLTQHFRVVSVRYPVPWTMALCEL